MSFERFLIILVCVTAVANARILPVGCYSNEPASLDPMKLGYQQEEGLTVSKCTNFCKIRGNAYAGISNGSACYCGDEFGLTDAVTTCDIACEEYSCGGYGPYDIYYVIDKSLDSKRKLKVTPEKKTFLEARRACIKQDGDLIGREIKNDNVIAEMKSLLSNANVGTKVWIGLRKRTSVYEWVDEREPLADDNYVKKAYEYVNMWESDDAGHSCVTFNVDTKKLASDNCTSMYTTFCNYLNQTKISLTGKQLTQEGTKEKDDKTLALFIVLPLFLICYGGACILYCIHKILKHCCKRGVYSQHVKLQQTIPSRPPTAKKNAVYPYPQAPISSGPMMLPMTAAEEKKLRLLENASREARSRRADNDDRPDSTRSTGRLLPPMASQRPVLPAGHAMPGLSINEILRNKMEQQANKKKPKRIIAT